MARRGAVATQATHLGDGSQASPSATAELANYLSTLYRDASYVERGRTAVRTAIAGASPDAPTDAV